MKEIIFELVNIIIVVILVATMYILFTKKHKAFLLMGTAISFFLLDYFIEATFGIISLTDDTLMTFIGFLDFIAVALIFIIFFNLRKKK